MKRYFFIFSFLSFIYAEDKSDLIIEIEKSLMATCFHGTVYEHGNQEMEKEISSFVEAGKDKDADLIISSMRAAGFNAKEMDPFSE